MASSPQVAAPPAAFHIMTKPIGPVCNLDCKYCFYLEKESLYPNKSNWRMSDQVLESYISQYIQSQEVPEISFAWQGGEPTLMGLKFFERIVELQAKYCPPGKRITNAVQTNGTLLDDDWCRFFAQHKFLIGLSIDGPRELHDRYRVDKGGKPSFDCVMAGLELMKKHNVEFNTLTVLHKYNARAPLDVYRFLRKHGSGFMQFIPLVERLGPAPGHLSEPPILSKSLPVLGAVPNQQPAIPDPQSVIPVTPWTVQPEDFGQFMIAVFDEWVRHDVGKVFVQLFEVQLGIWMGMPSSLCVFAETCGRAMALEHNGDLYSCDHYVYPRYHQGNITQQPLRQIAFLPQQEQFGNNKRDALPKYCRECDVRFACNGECPKHRFLTTTDGEPGLNWLCAGYKMFFHHVDPYMTALGRIVRSGQPAAQIMAMVAQDDARRKRQTAMQTVGRNDPCPCGSGKKYKRCCLSLDPRAAAGRDVR
jgi:uncharacterized protein